MQQQKTQDEYIEKVDFLLIESLERLLKELEYKIDKNILLDKKELDYLDRLSSLRNETASVKGRALAKLSTTGKKRQERLKSNIYERIQLKLAI